MNEEPKRCAYCDLPITTPQYTYKYFPDLKLMLPVHNEHLRTNLRNEEQ